MKKYIFLLAVVATVFSLSCQKSKENKELAKTFVFRISAEPPNIDPLHGVDQISIDVMNNLMEGLLQFDPQMKAVPALAESYKVSSDGKTYIFNLRKGIKWTDGIEFTAQQVVESWELMLNPKSAAEYAYFFYHIQGAEDYNTGKLQDFSKVGVKAVNPFVLEVKLKKPVSYFPSLLAAPAMFPVRVDLYKKFGDKWTEPGNIQSLGAYKLVRWEHDKQMIFEANENYWEGKPKLEKAIARIIPEATTAVNLFESGEIDLVRRLPLPDMDRFKNDPRLKIEPYFRNYYYAFDTSKKPFSDVKVRRAFAHAIQRSDLQKILRAGQKITKSWIPFGMFGENNSIGVKEDLGLAKKAMAEAGYPDGKGFPSLAMVFDSREDNQMIAEALHRMWSAAFHINLEIQNQELKVFLGNLKSNPPAIFRYGWGADYPDPHNFMDVFLSNSGNNYTRWKSKSYDRLVEQASVEASATKRKKLYDQAQKILLEDEVVIVPLFNESSNYLLQSKVKIFSMDLMANLFLKRVVLQ